MKKFGIRLPILCALVLLVCVTALATVRSNVQISHETAQNVTVEFYTDPANPELNPAAAPATFKITRQQAGEEGKLYLVVIRKGEPANPDDPIADKENLVYMGMETVKSGGVVTLSNAYPMDMGNGTYYVYMSDYGANKLQQVGTFNVDGSGGSSLDTTGAKLGDIDGNGEREIDDITKLIKLVANRATLEEAGAVADVNSDNDITVDDITALIKIVANRE